MNRTLIVGTLALFVGMVAVGCREDGRPSWWPEKKTGRFANGLDWPPPKPGDWPPDKAWPPEPEIGEDPEFWTRLYGEEVDSAEDERLEENGEFGEMKFRYNFEAVQPYERTKEPGCGLFTFPLLSYRSAETCSPYPEETVRAHCREALDLDAAERQCQVVCIRNKRRCRRGRLIPPAFYATWGCDEVQLFNPGGSGNPVRTAHQTYCFADYLCDCYEN